MSTITKLCPRGILLDRGRIEMAGEMRAVVARYLSEGVDQSGFADLRTRGDRSGSGEARFLSVELLQGTARCTTVPFGSALTIRCLLDVRTDLGPAPVEVEIRTTDGIRVHDLWNWNDDCAWSGEPGLHQFVVVIPEVHLYPDTYWIDLWIGDQTSNRVDYLTSAISFQVVQTPESPVQMTLRRSNGLVFQHSRWTHEALRLEGAGSGSTGRA
jgi:hypothetical protein